jgi:hypothetical protein
MLFIKEHQIQNFRIENLEAITERMRENCYDMHTFPNLFYNIAGNFISVPYVVVCGV